VEQNQTSSPQGTKSASLTIALKVEYPVLHLGDDSHPAPDELREAIIAALRGLKLDANGLTITITDAAPRVGHLR
jgi:hypothetical protein